MDGDLKRTVQFLLERNVSIVVLDEKELKLIHTREANAKANSQGIEKASSSVKGEVSNNNVISKAALAQRTRRERERKDRMRTAQRARRERERSGECIQLRQPKPFPSLILSRRRRACLERARMKAVTSHVTQSISISMEISKNAPKWTMVPNASGPSSMAAIVSQTPDLVEHPINGRCPPLTNRMPSYPIPPDKLEISPTQNQTRENSMHFVPAATTNQMVPARTFPYGALSVPDSLGKPPGIAMHTAQSDSLKVTLEVPHSIDSKWIDDKQRTKQFISSPMSLKERDESSRRDYIQMLLHLPPAELSRHAVELEKRAVQLTREEGKEIQRAKDLNIFGQSGLTIYPLQMIPKPPVQELKTNKVGRP
ncbi:hypothetical protein CEY00_Acc26460 [Actinidia chinensis var. chinensis]|uniref:Uncharacterized protein n=1 Tax=Actinidia chinensis var. chinensis TaxID=1590841 RepID=A0A2R6PTL9_ACTCC|nr:hypothetical protein CEY00_Acc26460 [Actinidia chinensis var. chinensis]